jgi:hypothetical protein
VAGSVGASSPSGDSCTRRDAGSAAGSGSAGPADADAGAGVDARHPVASASVMTKRVTEMIGGYHDPPPPAASSWPDVNSKLSIETRPRVTSS